jgi:hypothetical protein
MGFTTMLVKAETAYILTFSLPDSNQLYGRKSYFYVLLPMNFTAKQHRIRTTLLNACSHMFTSGPGWINMFGNGQGITGVMATGAY